MSSREGKREKRECTIVNGLFVGKHLGALVGCVPLFWWNESWFYLDHVPLVRFVGVYSLLFSLDFIRSSLHRRAMEQPPLNPNPDVGGEERIETVADGGLYERFGR